MKTLETVRDWRSYWQQIGQRIPASRPMEQIGWTIGGQPVDLSQVDLICEAIASYLSLSPDDVLVDLCCGNGLVTERLASLCRQVLGIDYSESLIASARSRSSASNTIYQASDVTSLRDAVLPGSANKLCMAAGLQYFGPASLSALLDRLAERLPQREAIVFVNVPDLSKLDLFCDTPERRREFEERQAAGREAMGTWWDRDELAGVLQRHGYRAEFRTPAPERLSAHYRFDLLAVRQSEADRPS
jgi:cyclopropane fatty-acyl-phospholipid synthase-like methyltransferase